MLKIYGTDLCPDCTACIAAFREAGIAYEYLKFETDLAHLREFLQTAASHWIGKPAFKPVTARVFPKP